MDDGLHFRLLGPLTVTRDGAPVHAGGPKQRAVLAMLLLDANRVVSSTRLAEGIWGEDVPDGAQATLQVHVSNLRKSLQSPTLIATRAPGYAIEVADRQVDVLEFRSLVAQARTEAPRDPAKALTTYEKALELWRGTALEDLQLEPFAANAATWLAEQRLLALEDRFTLALSLGHERTLVTEIEAELVRTPLSERLWRLLMLALYRSGRQADALGAYRRARETLDELGLEPSAELRAMERDVLNQDASLDRIAAAEPVVRNDVSTIRAPRAGEAFLELPDGQRLPLLDRPFTLGRQDDCDLVLADPAVSRHHAEIRSTVAGHLLLDNGSTNGTTVNGAPVLQSLLQHADVIQVGALVLRYCSA